MAWLKRTFLFCFAILAITCNFTIGAEPEKKNSPEEKMLFSFGIMADVQWADKEERGARRYRTAITKLKECVADLNTKKLDFTIQLGDCIDGNTPLTKTREDLDRFLEEYGKLNMATYHVVGNHCRTAGPDYVRDKFGMKKTYYDFTIPAAKGWRFVVLDGNDGGYGVCSEEQLIWLEAKLAEARDNGEKVIVFNHYAVLKEASTREKMNKPLPVLNLLNGSGCVVAYFAGHNHKGGYAYKDGIYHVTMRAMVEAPIRNAYAVVEVYPSKIKEVGHGNEPSRQFDLKNLPLPPSTQPATTTAPACTTAP